MADKVLTKAYPDNVVQPSKVGKPRVPSTLDTIIQRPVAKLTVSSTEPTVALPTVALPPISQ